ncbi:alanine racemase [Kitasatospora atroaurantiaca]|uniref:Alanine racemase-like protein n=1 Tax=Kitasatospora atroaurantiaca TaxID=285545 RepID=A0A561ESJ9_9ACTN|nr:alanine racemase [Kitasatospora atroaurantiaca]TWE18574.1 alanine racemase-like protein [Kitasatospora atroaurantiaca]
MTLSLYVDAARWRAHQRAVLAEFPGLVPVAKGNGYGFGNGLLAGEAGLLRAADGRVDCLAVGTAYEAADAAGRYEGELLVLTPYRTGEESPELPRRVLRTVAHVEALRALPPGSRVVVECMTSMRRHGIGPADLGRLPVDSVTLEGFALHLPLDRPDGSDPVAEVAHWVRAIGAAGLPARTVFLSHLGSADLARLARQFPATFFRSRIGTRLWLGEIGALESRATVLDVTPVARGDRYGYRQHKAPSDGHLLVVTGGTAHGVGLEAPKYVHGMVPRAKGLARAGLATVNRTLSPYAWAGRQLWFAEPPHMQVSILFLPGDTKAPSIGDELSLNVRHTTTHFDRVVLR